VRDARHDSGLDLPFQKKEHFAMERCLLVAIDETPCSTDVVHYLKMLFAQQADLRFHLLGIVHGPFSQAGKSMLSDQELLASADTSTRNRVADFGKHIHYLRDKMVGAGIKVENLTAEVRLLRSTVAEDLLFAARNGQFDGLAMGKRNIGLLGKMLLGSVSTEVLQQNHDIPLWVVGGRIASPSFFVPVDCSPHSLRAVDHLAFILGGNPQATITLFHSCSMFSAEKITPVEEFYRYWGKEWCDLHLRGEEDGHFHFQAAEQLLRQAGFSMKRVRRLRIKGGVEPGQQIVRHVKHEPYGTLVMGRRGKEVDKGIFRGVSDRVLANVEGVAVWIVG